MTSAQLDIQPHHEAFEASAAAALATPLAAPPAPPFALQQQVAERLAAHRSRRTRSSVLSGTNAAAPAPASTEAPPRSARIAATVAERYAHSKSYRAFLAEEAQQATRQAQAAAEVAHRNARAVAHAQQQLLAELDHWDSAPESTASSTEASPQASPALQDADLAELKPASPQASAASRQPSPALNPAHFTVRLYEDIGRSLLPAPHRSPASHLCEPPLDHEEALALDEEIAFRQAPVFAQPAEPPVPLPANLLEFPRQLVAARRVRPRLAEGPLRDQADLAPTSAQLRIFEVQAMQISTLPALDSTIPEWSSIRLDAPAVAAHIIVPETLFSPALPPQTAPLRARLVAAVIDVSLVVAASACFAATFAATAEKIMGDHLPLRISLVAFAIALPLFAVLFFLLFFSFTEATPGMRYARIGLCTFSDENPTRKAMRRRLFAICIAAFPLGIGFLWAWLDDDRLGWHDRISHMYQRSY